MRKRNHAPISGNPSNQGPGAISVHNSKDTWQYSENVWQHLATLGDVSLGNNLDVHRSSEGVMKLRDAKKKKKKQKGLPEDVESSHWARNHNFHVNHFYDRLHKSTLVARKEKKSLARSQNAFFGLTLYKYSMDCCMCLRSTVDADTSKFRFENFSVSRLVAFSLAHRCSFCNQSIRNRNAIYQSSTNA